MVSGQRNDGVSAMPDQTQDPMNLPPSTTIGGPDAPEIDSLNEEDLAKAELARISPTKAELEKFIAKCGPLPKWLDEDEPLPF